MPAAAADLAGQRGIVVVGQLGPARKGSIGGGGGGCRLRARNPADGRPNSKREANAKANAGRLKGDWPASGEDGNKSICPWPRAKTGAQAR